MANVQMPALQEFLKAGVQFGHETKRWNPRMKKYIYGSKNGIHVIDLSKTLPLLEQAIKFLTETARRGPVLFVGTKRQTSEIVKKEAIRSGAYYITDRWAGGLLTNFSMITQSLNKLKKLEEDFENGVEGRTKYEISKMKVEWAKLSRLYGGVKNMKRSPEALVVVDSKYEIGSIVEARKLKIPVIALTDTNSNPENVDYIIPANDDALGSIGLIMKLLADAVLEGNGGQGVKHDMKDYSKMDIKIVKTVSRVQESQDNSSSEASLSGSEKTEDKKEAPKHRITRIVRTETESKPAVKAPAAKAKAPKAAVKETKVAISARTQKTLEAAGLTLEKAKAMSDDQLKEIKGLGEKSIEEIKKAHFLVII